MTMHIKATAIAAAIMAASFTTLASANVEMEIDSIKQRFYSEIEEKKQELKSIMDDQPSETETVVGFKVETGMVLREIKLDLPEIAMGLQSVIIGIPQTAMRLQRLVFHTPSVRMVPKKVGQYPEFYGTTVKWSDIITHVPEVFMEKQEVKLHVPEFWMENVEMKFHVPEVTMKPQIIKLHLPNVTIRDTNVEIRKMKDHAKDIGDEIKGLSGQMSSEINAIVLNDLRTKRAEIVKKFDSSINALQGTINAWVHEPKVDITSMKSSLKNLQEQRNAALQKIDEQIAKLS